MLFMKSILKIIWVIFLFTQCSSDSETENNQVENNEEFKEQYELFVNGEDKSDTKDIIYRVEDRFYLGDPFYERLVFHKSGKLGLYSYSQSVNYPPYSKKFSSFHFLKSKYFNFKLESLDEVNKTVKISFSGYLYSNPLDLKSELKFVSGKIYSKYVDLIPSIFGVKNTAKINNQDWHSNYNHDAKDYYHNTTWMHHFLSDDEYRVSIYYQPYGIEKKEYNFSSTDLTNKVQLCKFDENRNMLVYYNCSGELNINQRNYSLLAGTYDFIAVNPNDNTDTIKVTNGNFRLVFQK